jgi:hypothetical protein
MPVKKMTVAEATLLLLTNFSPYDEIEFDFTLKVTVSTPTKVSVAKLVSKNIFEIAVLGDPSDAEEGDLVYLDYTNPSSGPVTRVGFVLTNDHGSLLIYDLSVDGVRRFDHGFIEDIHLLS